MLVTSDIISFIHSQDSPKWCLACSRSYMSMAPGLCCYWLV